jgi:hypothetical protein
MPLTLWWELPSTAQALYRAKMTDMLVAPKVAASPSIQLNLHHIDENDPAPSSTSLTN